MKIKKVQATVLRAQDTGPYSAEMNVGGYAGYQVVVHVETDESVDGWGECCTGGEYGEAAEAVRILIEKGLAPRVLGADPTEFRRIWERLYNETAWFGRRGLAIFALSGLDTALVDIAGKALGLPAHKILGGSFRNEVPLYASLLFDMDDVEGTAKKGLQYVNAGYKAVKYGWGMVPTRPFGANPKKDEEMVSILRDRLGQSTWIMVDVGRYVTWTAQNAIQMAKRFEKYNIFWLEEALPQDDIDGYVELTRSVDTTVACGECLYTIYDFKELISKRAVDLIQPDASKVGGISEMKRIIDLAHINNMAWVPHNWSTAINTAASLQLVASSPDGFLMEFKQEPNPLVSDLSKWGFDIRNGSMRVPEKPGLGIEVDLSLLDKYSA